MAKTGHSGGRRMQRCSNRGSSIGAGSSSSSDSGSRVGWSVVSGMPDIKIPQTLAFHVPGQPLRCPTPSSRFTYNPFPPFLGHPPSFIRPFHPSCIRTILSLPHFLLALPLAATSFSSGFPAENISVSVPKTELPAFPISLSSPSSDVFWRSGSPALLMKSRRYYAHAAMCTMYSWAVRANIKSFAATFCAGETTW